MCIHMMVLSFAHYFSYQHRPIGRNDSATLTKIKYSQPETLFLCLGSVKLGYEAGLKSGWRSSRPIANRRDSSYRISLLVSDWLSSRNNQR